MTGLIVYSHAASDTGRNTGFDLFTVRPDGTGRRRLTDNRSTSDAGSPSCSPDGRRLLYRTGRTSDIWMMDVDGSHKHPVITGPSVDDVPTWAPDGSGLLFLRETSFRLPPDLFWYTFRPARASRIKPAGDPSRRISSPSWSPDGNRILVTRYEPFGEQQSDEARTKASVYVMRRDSPRAHLKVVARNPMLDFHDASWSPDGTQIAFLAGRVPAGGRGYAPTPQQLYLVEPDGSHLRPIDGSAYNRVGRMAWAPDGKSLLLSGQGASPEGSVGIWIQPLDGSPRTLVVADDLAQDGAWCRQVRD